MNEFLSKNKDIGYLSQQLDYNILLLPSATQNAIGISLDKITYQFNIVNKILAPLEIIIKVIDTQDIFNSDFIATGYENVLIQLQTPESAWTATFMLTEINSIDVLEKKYEIRATSIFGYIANAVRIQKGYVGKKKISDIVKDVLTEELKISNVYVEETETELENFIIPNWTVYELFNYLIPFCKPKNVESRYVWYQSVTTFCFESMSNMYEKNKLSVPTYRKTSVAKNTVTTVESDLILEDSVVGSYFNHGNNLTANYGIIQEQYITNEKKVKYYAATTDKTMLSKVKTLGKHFFLNETYVNLLLQNNKDVYYEKEELIETFITNSQLESIFTVQNGIRIKIKSDMLMYPGRMVTLLFYRKDGTLNLTTSGVYIVGSAVHSFALRASEGNKNNMFFTDLYCYRDTMCLISGACKERCAPINKTNNVVIT